MIYIKYKPQTPGYTKHLYEKNICICVAVVLNFSPMEVKMTKEQLEDIRNALVYGATGVSVSRSVFTDNEMNAMANYLVKFQDECEKAIRLIDEIKEN